MRLPDDYERASASTEVRRLTPGGYVCQIKKVEADDKANQLRVFFDIFEGDYKGFYKERYSKDKERSSKAAWRGTYNLFVMTRDGRTNPFFKGFIQAVQDSNPNAQLIRDGELQLEGFTSCLVGLLFRQEEFRGQDGNIHSTVRPCMAVSDKRVRAGDYTTPAPRLLERSPVPEGFIPVEPGEEPPF